MDNVNNRRLFRQSQAARDKVRQLGGIQDTPAAQGPQGILASFTELMQAAQPIRGQGLLPMVMQQTKPLQPMQPVQMPMPMPQMQQVQPTQLIASAPQARMMPQKAPMQRPAPQARPVRMQQGGDVITEAIRQYVPSDITATMAPQQPVDISAAPTPRQAAPTMTVEQAISQRIVDNPEAQAKVNKVRSVLSDPNASAEAQQEAITQAAGVENNKEGLRKVASYVTGEDMPKNASVDELNRAITGVALGGAIGGPRSAAERISKALLMGLEAARETETKREDRAAQLALAAARSAEGQGKDWLSTQAGKNAAALYEKLRTQQNRSHEDTISEMNKIYPGLGDLYQSEMGRGSGAPAAAPAAPQGGGQSGGKFVVREQGGNLFRVYENGKAEYIGPAN